MNENEKELELILKKFGNMDPKILEATKQILKEQMKQNEGKINEAALKAAQAEVRLFDAETKLMNGELSIKDKKKLEQEKEALRNSFDHLNVNELNEDQMIEMIANSGPKDNKRSSHLNFDKILQDSQENSLPFNTNLQSNIHNSKSINVSNNFNQNLNGTIPNKNDLNSQSKRELFFEKEAQKQQDKQRRLEEARNRIQNQKKEQV